MLPILILMDALNLDQILLKIVHRIAEAQGVMTFRQFIIYILPIHFFIINKYRNIFRVPENTNFAAKNNNPLSQIV